MPRSSTVQPSDLHTDRSRERTIYLLCWADRPYAHAAHYLGSTDNLRRRLRQHARGEGARLMQVICLARIPWQLARTWPGDRREERRLKRRHSGRRLCPVCNPSLRCERPIGRHRPFRWEPEPHEAASPIIIRPQDRLPGDPFAEAA